MIEDYTEITSALEARPDESILDEAQRDWVGKHEPGFKTHQR